MGLFMGHRGKLGRERRERAKGGRGLPRDSKYYLLGLSRMFEKV